MSYAGYEIKILKSTSVISVSERLAVIEYLDSCNGVFPKWNGNSGNPINHWSMKRTQFKAAVSHMCLAGIVVSYTIGGWVADSNPFAAMTNIFVTEFSEFSNNISWKLNSIGKIYFDSFFSFKRLIGTFTDVISFGWSGISWQARTWDKCLQDKNDSKLGALHNLFYSWR